MERYLVFGFLRKKKSLPSLDEFNSEFNLILDRFNSQIKNADLEKFFNDVYEFAYPICSQASNEDVSNQVVSTSLLLVSLSHMVLSRFWNDDYKFTGKKSITYEYAQYPHSITYYCQHCALSNVGFIDSDHLFKLYSESIYKYDSRSFNLIEALVGSFLSESITNKYRFDFTLSALKSYNILKSIKHINDNNITINYFNHNDLYAALTTDIPKKYEEFLFTFMVDDYKFIGREVEIYSTCYYADPKNLIIKENPLVIVIENNDLISRRVDKDSIIFSQLSLESIEDSYGVLRGKEIDMRSNTYRMNV